MITLREPTQKAGSTEFRQAANDAEILHGRRLQARVYAAAGYDEDFKDGLVVDKWVPESTYFVGVAADSVVGVSRVIHPRDHTDLPALRYLEIEPAWRTRIASLPSDRVAEISALAVDRQLGAGSRAVALGLYRAMYHHAFRTSHERWWVAMADLRLFRTLTSVLWIDFKQIGEIQYHRGGYCVPCILDLDTFGDHMRAHAPDLLAWFNEGLDVPVLAESRYAELVAA